MQRDQAHRTNELLERIAIALEKNTANVVYNGELKHTNNIPGFEGVLNDLDNLYQPDLSVYGNKDEEDDCGANGMNHYLDLKVKDLSKDNYLEFCSIHSLPANDAVAVSNYIAELDYEECQGAINEVVNIIETNDDVDEFANSQKDIYEYDLQGLRVDSDHDIRSTAAHYEIEYIEKHGATKKECILDYVTNEFGLHGARYTDIIKFAYYLGAHNAPKYDNSCRGYYAMAFNTRYGGHLIQGGKDFLVKGINKEGKERYFAHSSVDSFTDYFKRIGR